MIRSQWDKFKRRLNIGYIRADNRLVVDVEECPIAAPELNRQLREVRAHPPPKGGIKVVLRLPPEGWEIPPDAFFQNNFILLPQLVATVRACLQDSGARFLMDVYCGVGFFSLELADQVEAFLGIEYDRRAVQAARRNALLRQRPNGEYLEGKTEAVLPLVMARFPRSNTAIILDPPRTGCPPVCLQTLRSAAPAQVIYVSCHPATLARDLKLLCAEGLFELVRLTPLDMFPQTQHIECVADLRCRRKPEAEASPPIDKIPLPRTQ